MLHEKLRNVLQELKEAQSIIALLRENVTIFTEMLKR